MALSVEIKEDFAELSITDVDEYRRVVCENYRVFTKDTKILKITNDVVSYINVLKETLMFKEDDLYKSISLTNKVNQIIPSHLKRMHRSEHKINECHIYKRIEFEYGRDYARMYYKDYIYNFTSSIDDIFERFKMLYEKDIIKNMLYIILYLFIV